MLVILIAAAVIVSAALAWLTLSEADFWRSRKTDTRVEREDRIVQAFHKIDLRGSADITLVQGTSPSVAIEAAPGTPVSIDVRDGTLAIDNHDGRRGWRLFFHRRARVTPRITITFTELSAIESSGLVNVRTAGIVAPALHIDVTGAGSLTLDNLQIDDLHVEAAGGVKASVSGHAIRQRIDISGAGDYEGSALSSDSAKIDVSGAGKVIVKVAKTLDVDISGAGSVIYIGNPEVTKTITGMGRVRQQTGSSEVRAQGGNAFVA